MGMEQERLLCFKHFMQQNYPQGVLKEEFGNVLRYQIPNTDSTGAKRELADMFALIETEKARLKIENYAIGQMSLEEIFNTFAAGQDNPDNERYKQAAAAATTGGATSTVQTVRVEKKRLDDKIVT